MLAKITDATILKKIRAIKLAIFDVDGVMTNGELHYGPDGEMTKIFNTDINAAGFFVKQILGGVSSVVNGLGALRNRLGDAHGKGKSQVRPAQRHAQLAVNLAGATALFLIETWQSKN